jgi:hypothetical protein
MQDNSLELTHCLSGGLFPWFYAYENLRNKITICNTKQQKKKKKEKQLTSHHNYGVQLSLQTTSNILFVYAAKMQSDKLTIFVIFLYWKEVIMRCCCLYDLLVHADIAKCKFWLLVT